jgi:hypothetical protein
MTSLPLSLIAAVGMSVALVTGAASVRAQDNSDDDKKSDRKVCNLKSVAGVYGFNADSGPAPGFAENENAGVGILELFKDGTLFVSAEFFVEGQTDEPRPIESEGTWDVGPDCRGFLDFTAEVAGDTDGIFVAVNDAKELFIVFGFLIEEVDAKRLFSD